MTFSKYLRTKKYPHKNKKNKKIKKSCKEASYEKKFRKQTIVRFEKY